MKMAPPLRSCSQSELTPRRSRPILSKPVTILPQHFISGGHSIQFDGSSWLLPFRLSCSSSCLLFLHHLPGSGCVSRRLRSGGESSSPSSCGQTQRTHAPHRGLRHPGRGGAFPREYTASSWRCVTRLTRRSARHQPALFLVCLCGLQVCGSVKDSAGEDLTNDSPDTNQSETVTTATGNSHAARQ